MSKRRFRLPNPALVISMVTLSLVLGGTAVAATATSHKDAKADTALVKKLAPSLSVKHAKTANSATNATNATNSTNATNATNATTAGNANNLGGQPPSAYVPSTVLQHGTFVLTAGTTGKVLFTDGPLSVTADCTQSAGVTTVKVNVVSTVANWLFFNQLQAAAGTVINDQQDDSSSVGTFKGNIDRLEAIAPSGAAFHGQDAYGVNYPSAGQCYVSAWVAAL